MGIFFSLLGEIIRNYRAGHPRGTGAALVVGRKVGSYDLLLH